MNRELEQNLAEDLNLILRIIRAGAPALSAGLTESLIKVYNERKEALMKLEEIEAQEQVKYPEAEENK